MNDQSASTATFIARLNIDHFKKKLATEMEESKRALLERLLAEEEAKLAELLGKTAGDQESA